MAHDIDLACNIARFRKNRGVTQEALASYLGVSKASVSKWETGQSFPDILLLPQLAMYFGVTLDQLVGYKPQLEKDAIKALYERLGKRFATDPFDEVLAECHECLHDYCTCYPLLTQMALLYLNHADVAPDEERRNALLSEIVDLCERVRKGSSVAFDLKQATAVEAMACMALGQPAQAVDLLQPVIMPDMGEGTLLVSAHLALGEVQQAQTTCQANVYQGLVLLMNDLPQMAQLSIGNPERLQEIYRRTLAIMEAFDLDSLYVSSAGVHLSFAQAFLLSGMRDQALDCIERYVRCCGKLDFPVKLRGDAFFDQLDPWLQNLDLGDSAPRDDELIRRSMVSALEDNPAFASLSDDSRLRMLLENLKEAL